MENCIFCNISEEEKIHKGKNFFVIKDINPVSEGHCLIISNEHYETIFDLPNFLGNELVEIIQEQGKRLIDSGLADGIKLVNNNYESSGQVVKHFHLHVIPEKIGKKREKRV